MKLTVLGRYGPYPAPGGACSGYLVEEDNTKVLIDCGSGVLSRLQQVCGIDDIDAVILSHFHSDHVADMLILRYMLDVLNRRGLREKRPLPVYAPGSPAEEFARFSLENVFEMHQIDNNMEIRIGKLVFAFREMTHPVQSFAVSVASEKKRLVYTGDTNYNEMITEFAGGADFFVADTGLMERDKKGSYVPHLTAKEVGQIARAANVKHLMITHLWPGYDENEVAREAADYYSDVIIAREMESYLI